MSSSSTTSRPSTTTLASTTTTTTIPPIILPGTVVQADVMVREASATTNFGSNVLLGAEESPGASKKRSRTFVRVSVSGIAARRVVTAKLRLQVASVAGAGSASGGRIHAVTACTLNELTTNWSNQPPFSATTLSQVGAVSSGNVAEFDVTSAINRGDGTYCFAVDSASTDVVNYNSRESTGQKPQFVVAVAP